MKHVRVFGCSAFVYNEHPKSKAHARAEPGIFLGCNDNGVYMVEKIVDRKLVNSVHVSFDEESFPGLLNSDSSSSGESSSSSETESLLESEGTDDYPFPQPSSDEIGLESQSDSSDTKTDLEIQSNSSDKMIELEFQSQFRG